MLKKFLSLIVIVCFCLTTLGPLPKAHADTVLGLPAPGTMINLSPAYEPVMIKGLTVHKDNPFLFDFIVDVGQDKMSGEPLKKEGEKLIKYFLASLAIPDKDVWVNLSPYEKTRMIPEALGQTDMGRDLLEQDYILKQITASLIYPEKDLGKKFWDKVYAKAQQMYGTTQIPVNTFNKVWIMADRAEVFEHNQTAFVVDSHLKVMLEEDYLALQKHSSLRGAEGDEAISERTTNNSHTIASQIVKQIILPELEKEVNTGKNFANLRQIFNSVILASWYKKNLTQALLNQVYSNKSKVRGINLNDPTVKRQIYEQYLKAYKKGVFNYIKAGINTANGDLIPRKYFSGGITKLQIDPKITTDQAALGTLPDRAMVDFAVMADDLNRQPVDDKAQLSAQATEYLDTSKPGDLFWYADLPDKIKTLTVLDNFDRKGIYWENLSDLRLALRSLHLSQKAVHRFEKALKSAAKAKDSKLYLSLIEKARALDRLFEYLFDYKKRQVNFSGIEGISDVDKVEIEAQLLRREMAQHKTDQEFIKDKLFEAAFVHDLEPFLLTLLRKFKAFVHEDWGNPEKDLTQYKDIIKSLLGVEGVMAAKEVSVKDFKALKKKIEPNTRIDLKFTSAAIENQRELAQGMNDAKFDEIRGGSISVFPKGSTPGAVPDSFRWELIRSIVIHSEPDEIEMLTTDDVMTEEKFNSILKWQLKLSKIGIKIPNGLREFAEEYGQEGEDALTIRPDARGYEFGATAKVTLSLERLAQSIGSESSPKPIKIAHEAIKVLAEIIEKSKYGKEYSVATSAGTDYIAITVIKKENANQEEKSGGARGANAAMRSEAFPGGIDLNTSNGMQWKVSKDGRGVEMNIDAAMIARIRREGIESLSPVILRITPVINIWSLIGLQTPEAHVP